MMTNEGSRVFRDMMKRASVEVTSADKKSLDAADALPSSEVFIANLPNDSQERLVAAAVRLRRAGHAPVPHIVARNIEGLPALDLMLRRLVDDAGVDRALILGGDRPKPAGNLSDSVQLLESGLFQRYGITQLYVGGYPEGHAWIPADTLDAALDRKVALAADAGIVLSLVSQFCFDASSILEWAARLRARGIELPLRVGAAGPASRSSLIRYAMICGIGPSLKVLRDREGLAQNMLAGETPEALLRAVTHAQIQRPLLGIAGMHFFTFGSLATTAKWINNMSVSEGAET